MHSDTKTGLALGILAVGLIGALFFRNDDGSLPDFPELQDPETVDARIAELDVGPYPTSAADGQRLARRDTVERPLFADRAPTIVTSDVAAPNPIPFHQPAQTEGPIAEERPLTSRNQIVRNVPTVAENTTPQKPPGSHQTRDGFRPYMVQPGDTLSGIAHRFLGASSRFAEIHDANRDRLPDPHRLKPGLMIRIPTETATAPSTADTAAIAAQPRVQPSNERANREPVRQATRPASPNGDDAWFCKASNKGWCGPVDNTATPIFSTSLRLREFSWLSNPATWFCFQR